ncbi:MAG: hypothetical protein JNK08_07445 [Sediminibacterium sp.]|nr:hypothetical protein [Sediminibacterium sp.]
MKKLIIIGIIIALLVVWIGEKRKFYHIGNNKYVTVWKTFGGVCYVVPDKYYGLVKPSDNFIETTNDNYLVLFFSQEVPNQIIYWKNRQDKLVKIKNKSTDKIVFVDYMSNHDSLRNLLYKPNPKNVRDLKDNAYLLDINIEANTASDKEGKDL